MANVGHLNEIVSSVFLTDIQQLPLFKLESLQE